MVGYIHDMAKTRNIVDKMLISTYQPPKICSQMLISIRTAHENTVFGCNLPLKTTQKSEEVPKKLKAVL